MDYAREGPRFDQAPEWGQVRLVSLVHELRMPLNANHKAVARRLDRFDQAIVRSSADNELRGGILDGLVVEGVNRDPGQAVHALEQ